MSYQLHILSQEANHDIYVGYSPWILPTSIRVLYTYTNIGVLARLGE